VSKTNLSLRLPTLTARVRLSATTCRHARDVAMQAC
jgi:hypothetical protein